MNSPEKELKRLSKTLAHMLRHKPWVYELELDHEGWMPVDAVLEALRLEREQRQSLSEADLQEVIATSDKQRYEIRGGRIRALYGHSLPGRLVKTPSEPPDVLYHGTSAVALSLIKTEGLRPMGRQYVHCSVDRDTAIEVARRKKGEAVLLEIQAKKAHHASTPFYQGNQMVWLADYVPAQFILFPLL